MLHAIFALCAGAADGAAPPIPDVGDALAPLWYYCPEEWLVDKPACQEELKLDAAQKRAVADEFGRRKRAIAEVVALLGDERLTETDRALKLHIFIEAGRVDIEKHRANLRSAIGTAAAARLAEIQRQIEGPLGPFRPRRKAEFELTKEQRQRVAARIPEWQATVRRAYAELVAAKLPVRPPPAILEDYRFLERRILDELPVPQADAWQRSQGAACDLWGIRPWAFGICFGFGEPSAETRRIDNGCSTRSIMSRAFRKWLRMTDEQQERHEELEQAVESLDANVAALIKSLPQGDAAKIWQAQTNSRDQWKGPLHRNIQALLDDRQRHDYRAYYCRQGSPQIISNDPWRTMFHYDQEAQGKAFTAASLESQRQMHEKGLWGTDRINDAIAVREEACRKAMRPEQWKLWQELTALERTPTNAELQEIVAFDYNYAAPRQRYERPKPKDAPTKTPPAPP